MFKITKFNEDGTVTGIDEVDGTEHTVEVRLEELASVISEVKVHVAGTQPTETKPPRLGW